jgi:hypothetical protein
MSVYITDLAVLAIFLLAGFGIGFRTYILIQLPVLYIGGLSGFRSTHAWADVSPHRKGPLAKAIVA